jgi:hypothetical protein
MEIILNTGIDWLKDMEKVVQKNMVFPDKENTE